MRRAAYPAAESQRLTSTGTTAPRPPGVAGEFREQIGHYARLMRLDRPIGIWLLLWPTLWALWIAADGSPDPWLFTVFVLGTVIMRSAGCVINDFADRRIDREVERTRERPLASGAVAPAEAIVLFVALGLVAIGLVLTLNRLSQQVAVAAAALTVVYPFSKRFFPAPQLVLGVAFASSVLMVFAAQTNALPRLAWLMWLATVVWAVVYDTMYAMADRRDDERIGIHSTAILFGQADVFVVCILQAVFLFAVLLAGEVAGLGMWYRLAVLVSALLMFYQFTLIRGREPDRCFRAFLNNRHVGATIFAGVVLSYTFSSPA